MLRPVYVLTFFLRIWPPFVMSDLPVSSLQCRLYMLGNTETRHQRRIMQSSHNSMWQFFAVFACSVAIIKNNASWASEMIFRPFKRACLTAWSECLLFDSFWLALWIDILSEFSKLLNEKLNAFFSRRREVNFNDEGIIFTLTLGYFKKCVSFRLQ